MMLLMFVIWQLQIPPSTESLTPPSSPVNSNPPPPSHSFLATHPPQTPPPARPTADPDNTQNTDNANDNNNDNNEDIVPQTMPPVSFRPKKDYSGYANHTILIYFSHLFL